MISSGVAPLLRAFYTVWFGKRLSADGHFPLWSFRFFEDINKTSYSGSQSRAELGTDPEFILF